MAKFKNQNTNDWCITCRIQMLEVGNGLSVTRKLYIGRPIPEYGKIVDPVRILCMHIGPLRLLLKKLKKFLYILFDFLMNRNF